MTPLEPWQHYRLALGLGLAFGAVGMLLNGALGWLTPAKAADLILMPMDCVVIFFWLRLLGYVIGKEAK